MEGVRFTEQAAKRIVNGIRRVEGMPLVVGGRDRRQVFDTRSLTRYKIIHTATDQSNEEGGVEPPSSGPSRSRDGEAIIPFYRGQNRTGIIAKRVDASGVIIDDSVTAEVRIYADTVRGVFTTGDVVWCYRLGNRIQIHDDGELSWFGEAGTDSTGDPLNIVLDGTNGQFSVTATPWSGQSVSMGTMVFVQFFNSPPGFYVMDRACPAYTVPEG